jgi:glutathione S-transferase
MTTDLKLCQSNGSPNSRRVRIFLAEKGVALTQIPVDLDAKEQFSDAYAAINPRRVVPTLVLEDGTAIGEVPAIMRYLDEAFPETPLLGSSPRRRRSSRCGSDGWSWKVSATAIVRSFLGALHADIGAAPR